MSVYPEGVGTHLKKASFSQDQIKNLKSSLPKNLIIRIYGLAGVGKGTVSKMLADTLSIPNLESSLILRCATFIYKKLDLDLTDKNTDLVFEKMDISVDSGKLIFGMEGEAISKPELKSAFVDKNINTYSSNLYVRSKFDEALDDLVQRVFDSACVADGRGSHEPYLVNAEKHGFKVVRILVDADQKIKAERYYQEYLKQEKVKNPDFQETEDLKDKVLKEFELAILGRDKKDIKNIEDKGIGLISEDSGILDTSYLTPQECLETALSFISSRL
jgi:cytidylate kinase